MGYTGVFMRKEIKFIITNEQREIITEALLPYMHEDKYGKTSIRNLYFDTPSFRLVRHSIEKPVYKEKMRIRSYGTATDDSTVFVELKKKYCGVVYKRRVALPENQAIDWTVYGMPSPINTQISREIDYFMNYYGELAPKVFLSYEREAYHADDESGFRVTFDEDIFARCDRLSLKEDTRGGVRLLDDSLSLMELKCSGGIPIWMTRVLTAERIYNTSFSKYGTAYSGFIVNKNLISINV